MRVPYHEQLNSYTCGPATLQMVMGYFGVHKNQRELAKKMKTKPWKGTDNKDLIRRATHEGFYCYVNNESTIFEIKHFLAMGLPVIVNYIEPSEDEGHYAVIVGYFFRWLILNDPWNGERFKISEKKFLARWYDSRKRYPRWIMVLSKKDMHFGKQYRPRKGKSRP